MFIYRPHLHQLDGTITPDLIVDSAEFAGHAASVHLSDQVDLLVPPQALVAACVVFAAGYGALLAPAFLVAADQPDLPVTCHVARQAWRLADVRGQLAGLELRLAINDADGAISSMHCPVRADRTEPAPGRARCDAALHAPLPAGAESVTLTLHDPQRGRHLVHRVFLRSAVALAA